MFKVDFKKSLIVVWREYYKFLFFQHTFFTYQCTVFLIHLSLIPMNIPTQLSHFLIYFPLFNTTFSFCICFLYFRRWLVKSPPEKTLYFGSETFNLANNFYSTNFTRKHMNGENSTFEIKEALLVILALSTRIMKILERKKCVMKREKQYDKT